MRTGQKLRRFRLAAFFAPALLAIPLRAQVPVTRAHIIGITYVRFKSTDFEKSRAFYEKVLGLGSSGHGCGDVSRLCYVVNYRQHIELIPAQSGDHGSFLDEIGFAVPDVQQMQNYLHARGVKTSKISRRPNHTLFFEVDDPEHNRIAFVEDPDVGQKDTPNSRYTPAPNQVSDRMLHAGFVVKDLERMKEFYVGLLGFRLYWYGGFKDDGIDWYEIQVPDGGDWIEFMLNISPTADRQELGVQNHFSLGVADAKTAAAKLRANGATTFDGPEVGRDGKNSLDIYDPDLSRVEVMDFTPTQTPCCHPYNAGHPKP